MKITKQDILPKPVEKNECFPAKYRIIDPNTWEGLKDFVIDVNNPVEISHLTLPKNNKVIEYWSYEIMIMQTSLNIYSKIKSGRITDRFYVHEFTKPTYVYEIKDILHTAISIKMFDFLQSFDNKWIGIMIFYEIYMNNEFMKFKSNKHFIRFISKIKGSDDIENLPRSILGVEYFSRKENKEFVPKEDVIRIIENRRTLSEDMILKIHEMVKV
jgi:hypothetical protein